MQGKTAIRAGVIGYGYWGPNLARTIAATEPMQLLAIADLDAARRAAARRAHPLADAHAAAEPLLADPSLDLIAIATPAATHYELARHALLAGKHVLVEKPFTISEQQAQELVELAEVSGRHLFVDHTFLFTGAVRRIREDIESLGGLLYYDATRTNLGTFQSGTDVLWDLAPHDLSILLSLVDEPVELVSAIGVAHAPWDGPTMAYVTLRFASGLLAHLHLNWLAPAKVRRTIIGGTRRMLVYDDVEAHEKVKFYDDAGLAAEEDPLRRRVDYRVGDVTAPRLDSAEALLTEMAHVARVLGGAEQPLSAGRLGLRVVRAIEAAQRSLALDGVPVTVNF